MKVNKKILGFCTAVLASSVVWAADLQFRLIPSVGLQNKYENSALVCGTLGIDLNAITIRQRDDIYFSLQGTPQLFISDTKTDELEPIPLYDIGFGAGYNYRINDRVSVGLEGFAGVWILPEVKDKLHASGNLMVGGRLSADYHINPFLSVSAVGAYKNLLGKNDSFLNKFEIGVGLTYNITKGLFSKSGVNLENYEVKTLFPVFYSRYEDNSFGTVVFKNGEKNDITDVEISLYIEQFMTIPKTVAFYPTVALGGEFKAELSAFLNENMLNQLQNQLTDAIVTVTYKNLGRRQEFSQRISLQTLTRNSMSWEDDRSAAAFVSGNDGAVQRFAKRISLSLKDKLGPYPNAQYAEAVFKVLKAYGINYVIDPASAFTDNVGTASIDFLQFPYQTLLYHGGDCDDLSILNCSLLEALGVQTAFITIPGHIYMAFDSGVPLELADARLGRGKYINAEGKAWIPVEITVPQDSYSLALSLGMKQWNKYSDDHNLIPIADAWKEYKPVSIPASDITLQFPKEALK